MSIIRQISIKKHKPSLGIAPTESGKSAGDITVETKYGILDSIKLNGVTLESVPVNIANIDHLAQLYDFELSGIIGTGVFSHL